MKISAYLFCNITSGINRNYQTSFSMMTGKALKIMSKSILISRVDKGLKKIAVKFA